MTRDPRWTEIQTEIQAELGRWRRIRVVCPSHRRPRTAYTFVSVDGDPWGEERRIPARAKRDAAEHAKHSDAEHRAALEAGETPMLNIDDWIAGIPEAEPGHVVRLHGKVGGPDPVEIEHDARPPLPSLVGRPDPDMADPEVWMRDVFEIRCRCGDNLPVRAERARPVLDELYAGGLREITMVDLRRAMASDGRRAQLDM